MKKDLPEFKTEEEEAEFWATHDSLEYIEGAEEVQFDFSEVRAKKSMPERKPRRLPKVAG